MIYRICCCCVFLRASLTPTHSRAISPFKQGPRLLVRLCFHNSLFLRMVFSLHRWWNQISRKKSQCMTWTVREHNTRVRPSAWIAFNVAHQSATERDLSVEERISGEHKVETAEENLTEKVYGNTAGHLSCSAWGWRLAAIKELLFHKGFNGERGKQNRKKKKCL